MLRTDSHVVESAVIEIQNLHQSIYCCQNGKISRLLRTYLVCTQSIGFPTYCRVVTAIENVTSKMTVAFVCKRNTAESVFT